MIRTIKIAQMLYISTTEDQDYMGQHSAPTRASDNEPIYSVENTYPQIHERGGSEYVAMSEAVQLEAVKSRKEAINYIDNPTEAVKEMANKKAASIKFGSVNEAIQHLADMMESRIIIAKDPIPTHLYHATYKPLLPSIKKKGLIKNHQNKNWEDSKNFIYLATSKDIAESYAETSDVVPEEWIDQIIVFKVDTNKLDLNQLSIDKNLQQEAKLSAYQYNKDIPFSDLKIQE